MPGRVVGSLRHRRMDHLIRVDQRHLLTILARSLGYYNTGRPRRTVRLETPLPAARSPTGTGAVAARPVRSGLHPTNERVA